MRTDLSAFIEHARERGLDHQTIRLLLRSAGWKEKDVVEAVAETSLDHPIPPPPDRGGAREAFLHLLTFASFYASVIALVMLLFAYVNRAFPDPAWTAYGEALQLTSIRWSLAFVIVAFPIFFGLSRLLLGEMRRQPERSWSGTRRWLTYLTLFFAALALGGDLIALVFRLLSGELSTRFLLKVAIVLGVAGLSFAYYLLSLRLPLQRPASGRVQRAFAGTAGTIVLATLAWGFVIAGLPGTARLQKFDERRVEDLRTIRSEILFHCLGTRFEGIRERKLQNPVPATLEKVSANATYRRPGIVDPENGEPYEYEALDERSFRVCATFRNPRDEDRDPLWNHPAGRHCYEFDVLETGTRTAGR